MRRLPWLTRFVVVAVAAGAAPGALAGTATPAPGPGRPAAPPTARAPASQPAPRIAAHDSGDGGAAVPRLDLRLRAAPDDPRPQYRPGRPFAELVAYQAFLVGAGWLYGHSPLDWDPPSWKKWKYNVTSPPVYPDGDVWWLNWAHAVFGSDHYLMARNSGWSWWSSALFTNFGSFAWEYVTEGLFERPSLIDLVSTPILGSLLGEVRYRLYQMVKRHAGERWYGRFAMVVLDPTTSVFELCGW
ncbi:MAG TPA: DUF3943 domain-containing protein [Polyangia bacterium]